MRDLAAPGGANLRSRQRDNRDGFASQIWMLTLYGKNVQENIPAHLLKQMKQAIDNGKDD